jgi:hypothetical protein
MISLAPGAAELLNVPNIRRNQRSQQQQKKGIKFSESHVDLSSCQHVQKNSNPKRKSATS